MFKAKQDLLAHRVSKALRVIRAIRVQLVLKVFRVLKETLALLGKLVQPGHKVLKATLEQLVQ